jgi:hypothetical protein
MENLMNDLINEVLRTECYELTKIYQTTNYKLFGKIKGNRNISNSHIKKLRQSIRKKYVKEVPIIVVRNPNFLTDGCPFLIIDGQHRHSAISEENIPISFVIADIPEEEILRIIELINTSGLEWDVTNFMGSKSEVGDINYTKYKSLYERFDFEHELFFYVMKKNGLSMNHSKFKDGLLTLTNDMFEEISNTFKWLEKYLPIVEKYGKRYYLKALLDLYYLNGVNLKRLDEVIFKRVNSTATDYLLYSGSVRHSLNHLVLDLYNHNLRKNLIGVTSLDRLGNKYKLEITN